MLIETLKDHFVHETAVHVVLVDLAGARVNDLNQLPFGACLRPVLWLRSVGSLLLSFSGGFLLFVLKPLLLGSFGSCFSLSQLFTSHLV